jgi:protein-S-isoprenylcysteine O-methyltransferase Ste14
MIPMGSGSWLLLTGYFLLASFIILEWLLRKTESSKKFQRGNFDRGSTLLVGAAFGIGLILPLIMDILDVGLFSITLVEGLLALAVMLIGIGFRVWSARTLGEYYTRTLLTTNSQKVISVGPYSRIRHPGYLGDMLLWSGFGVVSSDWIILLLFPVLFVVVYLYRISVEEKMLIETLGDEYVQYRKRTYRLVPFVY